MCSLAVTGAREGEIIGNYRVIDTLGRSLTGPTYHIFDTGKNKELVMKTFLFVEKMPLAWLEKLELQTKIMSSLSSPSIDRVFEYGMYGSLWYLLKDFCHRGGERYDLRMMIAEHAEGIYPADVRDITLRILAALDNAQQYTLGEMCQTLHHGNLKPENILFSSSSLDVRLTDFQPMKLMTSEEVVEGYMSWLQDIQACSVPCSLSFDLNEAAFVNRYIPPEYADIPYATAQGDMYSLGIMMYEMLTGEMPYGRFPMPGEVVPGLSEYWDALIARCLQHDPEERYSSYQDMSYDVMEYFGTSGKGEWSVDNTHRPTVTPQGMVYIPRGEFLLGSCIAGDDASPQHGIEVRDFSMDRTLVTVGQYARFIESTGYVTQTEREGLGAIAEDGKWTVRDDIHWLNPMGGPLPEDFDDHPVTQVTYADAVAYADWAGRRLPTEGEWEYAAKGGDSTIVYPWGKEISQEYANYNSDGTCAVMTYNPNGFGLYDMAGNVWEWTSSWYIAYPGNERGNNYFGETYKVVRGGSWKDSVNHCMSSFRNANQLNFAYPSVGFRTVKGYK